MVTWVAGRGRTVKAGVWAVIAAGLMMTVADVQPAAAFGLGSLGDVGKGISTPGPMPQDPFAGEHQEGQDAAPPPAAASNEPPAHGDRPPPPDFASRHEAPAAPAQEQAAQPPAPSPVAAPAAEPAAVPAAPSAPAPVEAAKTPDAAPAQAAAAPAQPAADGSAASPAATALQQPTPDYYGERAKSVLAEEKKGRIKLHPVQTAAPDYDILLCEAGCDKPGLQILSKKLKTEAVSAAAPASANPSVPLANGIECLGGCGYGNSGQAGRTVAMKDPGDEAGTWMTTTKPRAAGKIPEVKPLPAPEPVPATAVEKPEAKAGEPHAAAQHKSARSAAVSEDWMARINRERAEKKAAQAKTAGDGIGPVAPLKVDGQ